MNLLSLGLYCLFTTVMLGSKITTELIGGLLFYVVLLTYKSNIADMGERSLLQSSSCLITPDFSDLVRYYKTICTTYNSENITVLISLRGLNVICF